MHYSIILTITALFATTITITTARNYNVDNAKREQVALSKDLVSLYNDWSKKDVMKRRLYDYYPNIKTGWPDKDYNQFAACSATPNDVGGPEKWFKSNWRNGGVWANFLGTNRNYQNMMYGDISQCGYKDSPYDSDFTVGLDSLSFGTHFDAVDADAKSRGKTCSPNRGCLKIVVTKPAEAGAGTITEPLIWNAVAADRIHENCGCYPRKTGKCSFFKGPQLDLPINMITIIQQKFKLKEWSNNFCVKAMVIPCSQVPPNYRHTTYGAKGLRLNKGRNLTLQEYLRGGSVQFS